MRRKKISELQVAATLLPNATAEAVQNANLKIYELPAEILAYIFLFHKHSTIEDETRALNQSDFVHDAVPYIAPSHVCSYWRCTALNTPSFWSTLLLNHSGWGRELIRRSGRSPLDVYRNQLVNKGHSRTVFMRCFYQALQEGHRIRTMNLANAFRFENGLWKSLPRYFTTALDDIQISRLESLTLSELPNSVAWFVTFSRITLAQGWGTIRELEMPYSTVCWIPTLPSNSIVNLRLKGIPVNDLHFALKQLGKFPRLESLALVGSWNGQGMTFQSKDMVKLPYLHDLELSFHLEACNFILDHLSDHRLQTLRISTTGGNLLMLDGEQPFQLCRSVADLMMVSGDLVYPCVDMGIGDAVSIFSFISEDTIRWSGPEIGMCNVPYQMLPGYDNSELNSEAPSATSQSSVPQNSSVVLSIPTGNQFLDAFTVSLDILWPGFSCTKTVVLRGSQTISPEVFQRSMETTFKRLSQLQSLEVLHIAGHLTGQHAIAKGLGIFNISDIIDSAEPIFPKLQSICLQGLVFDHASYNPNSFWSLGYFRGLSWLSRTPPFYVIPYNDFISSIQSIKAAGAPDLQYISFKSCYQVGDSFVADLEKMGLFIERDRNSTREFPTNRGLIGL